MPEERTFERTGAGERVCQRRGGLVFKRDSGVRCRGQARRSDWEAMKRTKSARGVERRRANFLKKSIMAADV